jgi:hypothetical protein
LINGVLWRRHVLFVKALDLISIDMCSSLTGY